MNTDWKRMTTLFFKLQKWLVDKSDNRAKDNSGYDLRMIEETVKKRNVWSCI